MNNVSIIGIGRLGLCVALCLEKSGYNVLGVDINENYINLINSKELQSFEPDVQKMLKESNNLRVTTSLEKALNFSNCILIFVDTPQTNIDIYDCSRLNTLLSNINNYKVENKHIYIGCTVMPGYNNLSKKLLSDCKNTSLNYNPEFIAQGSIIKDFINPDILLIGEENTEAGDILLSIYSKICKNQPRICRMTPTEAEICKISINGFITMKISYANTIGDLCTSLECDSNKVLETIGNDSRIGNKYFKYGYSFGGPCFPRDSSALKQVLEKNNINNILSIATDVSNQEHCHFQAIQLMKTGDENFIFENVTYKDNCKVPIIEESAKLKIASLLVTNGKTVTIKDDKHILNEVYKQFGNKFNYVEKNC